MISQKRLIVNEALETMRGLHGVGAINKQTLRDFETPCLAPPAYQALEGEPAH